MARIVSLALILVSLALSSAQAADHVTVGKAVSALWAFVPADIGVQEGIFAKYGLGVEVLDLGNSPRLHQAMTAGSVDFAMTSGADLAFVAKGEPARAIAAFATDPRNISIATLADSPIKTVADLKAQRIAISGTGSVSGWLVRQMAIQEDWGKDGVLPTPLGSGDANLAALRTRQVGAMVASVEVALNLEAKGIGRMVTSMGKYAPHFHAHMMFARKPLIDQNPAVVDRFLKGFFASIAFMKANKEETSKVAAETLRIDRSIADRVYDEQIGMLETDGHIDPTAIALMKQSFL
ncbi:MAG TPA: ABC transporter substrate-binding protein, partial [Stellaceae bacterium]|nr:ABC transporter substrate-binding protein [Stellaceae bacterium]